jgi:hypothetical protein
LGGLSLRLGGGNAPIENEPNYGLTRMALKLGSYFSGFTFPVAVAVLSVFEMVAGFG